MPKWNGLEVPKLPRGVYLSNHDNGMWVRANTEEYPEAYLTSEEQFREQAESNEYEFDEEGEMA